MSNEFKLVPVRREVLEQAAHWLHVHHNGPSAETNAADDLLAAIKMSNAEEDNPCLNCSGTGEYQSSGYSCACSECRGSGKSSAPQPPALGGEPVVIGTLHRDCDERIVFESSGEIHIKDGMPVYGDTHLAPLQAEIERLKDNVREVTTYLDNAIKKIERLRNDLTGTEKERDQLKARFNELEGLLGDMQEHNSRFVSFSFSDFAERIESALSKPAGSEQS